MLIHIPLHMPSRHRATVRAYFRPACRGRCNLRVCSEHTSQAVRHGFYGLALPTFRRTGAAIPSCQKRLLLFPWPSSPHHWPYPPVRKGSCYFHGLAARTTGRTGASGARPRTVCAGFA
eukprot:364684-Chlamydomonas_euryale.AAC.6